MELKEGWSAGEESSGKEAREWPSGRGLGLSALVGIGSGYAVAGGGGDRGWF